MKWIIIGLGVLALLSVAGILYVRLASHDPARWHVDPVTVTEVDTLNQYLDDRVVAGDLQTVTGALAKTLGGDVLEGRFELGFVTLVVRTPLIGYPDYVSVRIAPADGGDTRVTIFSRSRFGKSDLGANKARVDAVFADLEAMF